MAVIGPENISPESPANRICNGKVVNCVTLGEDFLWKKKKCK